MNGKGREKLAELRFSNLERYFDQHLNQLGFLFALMKQREANCGKGDVVLKYRGHAKGQEENSRQTICSTTIKNCDGQVCRAANTEFA